MDISIFFGGCVEERGISINSARAAFDILKTFASNIKLFYIDQDFKIYEVFEKHIYSNTPDDFCFLINPIENFWDNFYSDFVIPLIHGKFGEDGEIQKILENKNIPFMFSSSKSCKKMFFKDNFCNTLWNNGFKNWDSFVFKRNNNYELIKINNSNNIHIINQDIEYFLKNNDNEIREIDRNELHNILYYMHNKHNEIILKPNDSGSSFYVFISKTYEESINIINKYSKIDFIIEERHIGKEFSIAVVDHIAYIPIEISNNNKIFDYRSKYFPCDDVSLLNPPNFSIATIKTIRKNCEDIFNIFEAKDMIRIDGWILDNGDIIYTEANPISSIEFNGVLFQSISKKPHEIFLEILNKNLKQISKKIFISVKKDKISLPILFGGNSSEKEVSLLSGSNVCIKLNNSNKYEPIPCLLYENYIYILPYHFIFKHCIKDIIHNIQNIEIYNEILDINQSIEKITFEEFLNRHKTIFLALHGGDGENGNIQSILSKKNIKYNGSNEKISKLCINKFNTINIIEKSIKEIKKIPRLLINIEQDIDITIEIIKKFINDNNLFNIILKPNEDGSSTGIIKTNNINDIYTYIQSMINNKKYVIINDKYISLPNRQNLILEQYIVTDKIKVEFLNNSSKILHNKIDNWIELTVGTLNFEIFAPSLSISSGDILTAEEKFQEGTGINITPPPSFIISNDQNKYIKDIILKICKLIDINTYCRIDLFFNRISNEIIIIEINTLPALSFATVIFQQALHAGYKPEKFIENIINI